MTYIPTYQGGRSKRGRRLDNRYRAYGRCARCNTKIRRAPEQLAKGAHCATCMDLPEIRAVQHYPPHIRQWARETWNNWTPMQRLEFATAIEIIEDQLRGLGGDSEARRVIENDDRARRHSKHITPTERLDMVTIRWPSIHRGQKGAP